MSGLPVGFEFVRGWYALRAAWLFNTLMSELTWERPRIRLFGRHVTVPRSVRAFGDVSYTYSGLTHRPAPWHPRVDELRRLLAQRTGIPFNTALVNLYRDGRDSVAWHADDEPELGERPTIASLSLGETRRFQVKERAAPGERGRSWDIPLDAGTLLVMSGDSQRNYLHAVPKTSAKVGPRINITFRQVVERG